MFREGHKNSHVLQSIQENICIFVRRVKEVGRLVGFGGLYMCHR
jgi:hypothetical protein